MAIRYIHTINGNVAGFTGKQICYANRPRKNGWHPKAVKSLDKIREEQKKSDKYREDAGFPKSDYGYQMIEV